MASFLAFGALGDGQTATVTSLSFTVPAGVTSGDRLVVFLDSSDSAMVLGTLPSGSTVLDAPRANGTSASTAVIEKQLSSADAGTTFTIPWTSGAARVGGEWVIFRGISGTTLLAVNQNTAATGTFVLPTVAGVVAGSVQIGATLRRRVGAAANTTIPSPYTLLTPGTSPDFASNYGAAVVNVFGSGGYSLSSAAGTVGGESFVSGGSTSLGANYVLALPTGPPALTGSMTLSGDGSLSLGGTPRAAGSLAISGSGALSLGGTPRAAGSLVVTGSGSLSFGGTPRVAGSLAVTGSGSLSLLSNQGAGALAVTGSGSLSLAVSRVTASGSMARSGVGTLAFSAVARVSGVLARSGAGTVTFSGIFTSRVKKWNGSAWVSTVVQKWNGSAWVPAVLKVWNGSSWG